MKIALDFDGVISNCGKLKSAGAKKLFGLDIPANKFKREIVVGEGLMTLTQYRQLQESIYATHKIGMMMEPVEGALHFLPKIISQGHTVRIVTSRDGQALKIAKEWSSKNGFELDFVGLGYGISKAGATDGFDVFIDDDLDKLETLVNTVPYRFLFSWSYNAHVEVGHIARRINSWEEIYHTIQAINGIL